MAFETPTLPALIARADSDLSALSDAVLRRSDQRVLSRVHSGTAYGLYGFLGWLSRQILPDTCDEGVLARWALMKDVPRTPASSASGGVEIRGTAGAVLDAGSLLQARDGRQYSVALTVVFTGDREIVAVRAVVPGAAGNAPAGLPLSLVSPAMGIQDQAEVGEGGLSAGSDEELLEAWRARVIRDFRRVPHGGAEGDYEAWAMEVPGVTRAWSRSNYLGLGTVGVFFVRDNDPDPVPDAEAIAAVQAHLDSKEPLGAEVYVLPPDPLPITYKIALVPDGAALRARVEQALRDLHLREADLGQRFVWTHIGEAISGTPGEEDHRLQAPAEDVVPAANQLPLYGGVEWL
ncbi:baseplate J/gp47 family protein [Bordetella bronchiseptica]|uniref:baseplate J/gp47 family protein n=1 Tax=Bordetella bronchiseptica TaxID=518 RepID=UPI000460F124|nr:baseplate J/gp47 family protein [Bordetella bronchiseptica]KDD50171.1 baseplate J-like protein [Bordetella bronchiseptica MBORD901]